VGTGTAVTGTDLLPESDPPLLPGAPEAIKSEAGMFKTKIITLFIPVVWLAVIAVAASTAAGQDRVTLHKVAEVDISGSVSSDGRFLSYTDWGTGNLVVHDFTTGKKRHLTNKGSWLESDEFALFATISPDNKRVAYAWFNRNGFYDLRMIGVDGSEPRVFFRDKNFYPWPRDWAPDGKYILATLRERDGSNRIVLISVADGSIRQLKNLDWQSPLKVSFSPDGKHIAYDLFPHEDSRQRDIYTLSANGKQEVPLVLHSANDLLLGWGPDGSKILLASDRTGTLDAWAIRVSNGRPAGKPERVLRDIGPNIVPLGFDRNGGYYFGGTDQRTDLYTAKLEPGTNRLLAPAKKIGAVGIETFTDWSPDGQFLASISHPGIALWDLYSWVLVIRSTETGEERRFPLKMTKFHGFHLSWSANGDSLLAQGRDHKGRGGFYRIDARTGEIAPLVQGEMPCPPECLEWPSWLSDTKVLFVRWTANGQSIVVLDRKTRIETQLYSVDTPHYVADLAVLPDGQQLAFVWRDVEKGTTALRLMPVTGGEPTEQFRLEQPESISALTWTPDGRYILFAKANSTGDGQRAELWRIPAAGGEPEELGLLVEGLRLYSLSLHPDGQYLAFTAGKPARREVWVIENALPPLKGENRGDEERRRSK